MVIDSKATPSVDLVIDVAATGCCTDQQTVVMVRHLLLGGATRRVRRQGGFLAACVR